ncbi:MAG: protein-disulfide reductase DsbD domain-containing protein, partial [Phycisphaerae bacterium]
EPAPIDHDLTLDREAFETLIARSTADYEPTHGGFGGAPKFPRQTLLEMLLVYARSAQDPQLDRKLAHTLHAMADGGMRDHLGGGFHRYSTDAKWLIPHFEIMLYDQAMLATVYALGYRHFENRRFAAVCRGICDFVLREMTDPAGCFYTAFDAEVDGYEGKNYLWKRDEVRQILGEADYADFAEVYGLADQPNFTDPHVGEDLPDHYVLHLPDGHSAETDERFVAMRQKLLDARQKRKKPLLDTKIITAWNALMARGLAHAGKTLDEPRYVQAAAKAVHWLLENHYDAEKGLLYRTSRDDVARFAAFQEDYAYLTWALLELYDATGEQTYRDRAGHIARHMRQRFEDEQAGGFFFTDKEFTDLPVRQKVAGDTPLPGGNAVAAIVTLGLEEDGRTARKTLNALAGALDDHPGSMSTMIQAAILHDLRFGALRVHGTTDKTGTRPPSLVEQGRQALSVRGEWLSKTKLLIQLQIKPGYHVNSDRVGTSMVATELALTGDQAHLLQDVEYPLGEMTDFPFAELPQRIYKDQASLLVTLSAPPANDILPMSLRYQACTNTACLPPVTMTFAVSTGRG